MFRGSDDKRLQDRIWFPAQSLPWSWGELEQFCCPCNQEHAVVIITGSYRRSPLLLSACLEKIVFDLCEWAFQVSRFVHSVDAAWQHLEACVLISNTSQLWLVMSSEQQNKAIVPDDSLPAWAGWMTARHLRTPTAASLMLTLYRVRTWRSERGATLRKWKRCSGEQSETQITQRRNLGPPSAQSKTTLRRPLLQFSANVYHVNGKLKHAKRQPNSDSLKRILHTPLWFL